MWGAASNLLWRTSLKLHRNSRRLKFTVVAILEQNKHENKLTASSTAVLEVAKMVLEQNTDEVGQIVGVISINKRPETKSILTNATIGRLFAIERQTVPLTEDWCSALGKIIRGDSTIGKYVLIGPHNAFGKNIVPRFCGTQLIPMISDVAAVALTTLGVQYTRPMYAGNRDIH